MPPAYELIASEEAEDHLWEHGLYVEDAYEVLDRGEYKVFRDRRYDDRVKLIGRDEAGRLLTFVITFADGQGRCRIITGWLADTEERTLYTRPGGSRYVPTERGD